MPKRSILWSYRRLLHKYRNRFPPLELGLTPPAIDSHRLQLGILPLASIILVYCALWYSLKLGKLESTFSVKLGLTSSRDINFAWQITFFSILRVLKYIFQSVLVSQDKKFLFLLYYHKISQKLLRFSEKFIFIDPRFSHTGPDPTLRPS